MTLRCFIAVELPPSLRMALTSCIDSLKPVGADVAWAARDTLHLTLIFLGSTEESVIPLLAEEIRKKVSHFNSFYIKIAGVGFFPSRKRPEVLWAGIEHSAALERLQQEIAALAGGFGFAGESRPFAPHLTLGRVRSPRRMADLVSAFNRFGNHEFGTVEVTGVSIMKSVLKPAGAEHCCLATILLSGGKRDVKGNGQGSE